MLLPRDRPRKRGLGFKLSHRTSVTPRTACEQCNMELRHLPVQGARLRVGFRLLKRVCRVAVNCLRLNDREREFARIAEQIVCTLLRPPRYFAAGHDDATVRKGFLLADLVVRPACCVELGKTYLRQVSASLKFVICHLDRCLGVRAPRPPTKPPDLTCNDSRKS